MGTDNKFAKIVFIIFLATFLTPMIFAFTMVFSEMFDEIKIDAKAIIGIALGVIVVWAIMAHNKFVSLRQRVKQAQGGIDVYLKQRFDLIPNLVETVKGYANYEKEVLASITSLRNEYENRNTHDIKQSEELNNKYTKLLAIVENYPELKANEAFLKLQKSLSKVESQLQAARRIYNSEVTEYNIYRQKFPSNIIGGIFRFDFEPLFEIDSIERENININM